MNIFRRHKERELARQAAAQQNTAVVPAVVAGEGGDGAPEIPLPGNSPADAMANLILMRLTEDRARLHDIQSLERKIATKAAIIGEYDAWVDGLIEAADSLPEGGPQEVLTTIMIWNIDLGRYERALQIAAVVLAKAIPLPPQFKRTAPVAIADQIADGMIAKPSAANVDIVTTTAFMLEEWDMPDEVRAKLFKARALATVEQLNEVDAAGPDHDGPAGQVPALIAAIIADCEEADRLSNTSGVRTLLKNMKSRQKKLPPPDQAPAKDDAQDQSSADDQSDEATKDEEQALDQGASEEQSETSAAPPQDDVSNS